MSDFDHAVQLAPDNPVSLGSRGQTYRALGQLEEALADLNHALELEPSETWLLYQRGLIHFRASRLNRAKEDIQSAIRRGEDAAEASDPQGRDLLNLALYHVAHGQVSAAKALYRRALELDSTLAREGLDDLAELEANGPWPPEGEQCKRLLHSHGQASK